MLPSAVALDAELSFRRLPRQRIIDGLTKKDVLPHVLSYIFMNQR